METIEIMLKEYAEENAKLEQQTKVVEDLKGMIKIALQLDETHKFENEEFKAQLISRQTVKYIDELGVLKYLKENNLNRYIKEKVDTSLNQELKTSETIRKDLEGKFETTQTDTLKVEIK